MLSPDGPRPTGCDGDGDGPVHDEAGSFIIIRLRWGGCAPTRPRAAGVIMQVGDHLVLMRAEFDALLRALTRRGYTIIAPTVREDAIVYDEIHACEELPVGLTDEQDAGRYRLRRRDDQALFGYAVGPQSWKQYQLPAEVTLWRARSSADGALGEVTEPENDSPRRAFLGARSCELHAMGILDRVLLGGAHVDPVAHARRADTFVVAVQCGEAGGTCFCASMGTGPTAGSGFDLALTEIIDDRQHYFVVEIGSDQGACLADELPLSAAEDRHRRAAEQAHDTARSQMGRELETAELKELLYRNYDHPRWDEVARRCLTCGNCTMVCPTCFCTTVEDVTDLTGERVERHQRWDSCFTVDYSNLHGGAVRTSSRSRYRQWMTHKLATWIDQFDSSGCVGCGRCITWCPVGIDLTEEARAIRDSDGARAGDDARG